MEVNYRQVKDIIKLVFPEVPLAPCQSNLWCIDRIDFKWRPTACPECLGAGIYFHYASCCVSNKSFSLWNELWWFVIVALFHPTSPHPVYSLTFFTIWRLIGGPGRNSAGTEVFDLEEGFLSNYLPVMCVSEFTSACVFLWVTECFSMPLCKNNPKH